MAPRSSVRLLARALAPNVGKRPRDRRDAVRALAAHLPSRLGQEEFEPFDADGRTFLTTGYMQRRLRDVGARCSGEKAARSALRWLCEAGLLEDVAEVKNPTAPETERPPVRRRADTGRMSAAG